MKKCSLFGGLKFDNKICNKTIDCCRKIEKNKFLRGFEARYFWDPKKRVFRHFTMTVDRFIAELLSNVSASNKKHFHFDSYVKSSNTMPENAKTAIKSNFLQSLNLLDTGWLSTILDTGWLSYLLDTGWLSKDFLSQPKMLLPRENDQSADNSFSTNYGGSNHMDMLCSAFTFLYENHASKKSPNVAVKTYEFDDFLWHITISYMIWECVILSTYS